jgi:hypothetical protein
MIIFGKPLSDYVRFSKLLIILIAAVGVTRLALTLTGTPNATAKWFSMTALMWIGVIYYSIRVQTTGFGTYRHLLPVLALPNFVAQAVAITGIMTAIFSGIGNIFSAPEFAFGGDGKTWIHVAAHLFFGTTAGSLLPWAFGSGIMAITKKVSQPAETAATGPGVSR